MANLNKVLLIGRLTRDPELRCTPQGTQVTEIGLAVNREYGSGAERRKETAFVDVTLWARQADLVCQYLHKGDPIFIEGRLSFHSWEAKDGSRRSKLRVVAENFQFLGGRSAGGGGGGGERNDAAPGRGPGPAPAADYEYPGAASGSAPAPAPPAPAGGGDPTWSGGEQGGDAIDDSEIPF